MTGVVVPRPGARLGAAGVRGITWDSVRKRWQVHLSIGQGRKLSVGRFVDLADAIAALEVAKGDFLADRFPPAASAAGDP